MVPGALLREEATCMDLSYVYDADGHVIEPGNLWLERLPADLREQGPHYYVDERGVFHNKLYGLELNDLPSLWGVSAGDMLDSMGLSAAMGVPIERVFTKDPARKHTIIHAPDWSTDGAKRLRFNREHGVPRAVLYPTYMLAGGTFRPDIATAVCRVYNDWMMDDYCAGSKGALIPVAALPTSDVAAAVAEVRRVAAKGYRAVFIRTNPVQEAKYSDRAFDALWQAIVDVDVHLGLHPLPMWDQPGTARGFRLPNIMASSALGFPLDMMFTVYDMMAGGVFDHFPTMRTMILEAGAAWIPSLFHRFEEHREQFGAIFAPDWKTPPLDIFERQMMVTVEACEEIDIETALCHLPSDRIALASDWPHYDGTPDLVDGFAKATDGLPDEDVRMIATGTLDRWFPA
jgi:predicted TIM-barrel fold metal-dependent hydrolase